MRRLAVVVHPTRPGAQRAAVRLHEAAREAGLEVADAEVSEGAEAIVALGGDGTILRASRIALAQRIPLLGINVGRLGFLSTVDEEGLKVALEALATGTFSIEQRMVVEAEASWPGGDPVKAIALNEILVDKVPPARVIEVAVSVGDEAVATFTADGFIVATPTGSTAYSLSAGGPVVEPALRVMVLTPVSAHYPLWRPMVVGTERRVGLRVAEGPAVLTIDGQAADILPTGAQVWIGPHSDPLNVVRLDGPGFFGRLQSRFHFH